MSQIQINRDRVEQIVRTAAMSLNQLGSLHPLEVILGLSEAVGRTIAVQEGTFLMHKEMMRVAAEHIENTVKAAYAASGKNPEALNANG